MRSLGRDEHQTGLRWGPLPCALQRLEADVRLPPHRSSSRLLIFPTSALFLFHSWDEWVPTARLLKFNEGNLALQKDLSKAQAAATSTSASASKTATSVRGTQVAGGRRKEGGRGTKRGREDDDGARRPEMRLAVPDTLKVLLVDDWEAVTKNNQVRFQSSYPPRLQRSTAFLPVGHLTPKSYRRRNIGGIRATYS